MLLYIPRCLVYLTTGGVRIQCFLIRLNYEEAHAWVSTKIRHNVFHAYLGNITMDFFFMPK